METNGRQRTRAEIAFHLGLACILLPVVTLPVVWALAIRNLRLSSTDPVQRRWSRRLLGLAVVDTLVAISLVVASLTGMQEAMMESADPPRIGVLIDDSEGDVVIRDVFEGSPADEAGLAPGDRVVAARDEPVDDARALSATLATGEPAVLEVERAGRAVEIEVAPRTGVEPPTVLPTSDTCAPASASAVSIGDLAPYALFLAVVIVLAGVGRRRQVRQWTFWLPFFGVLVLASIAGSAGTWLGCALVAGGGMRASSLGLAIGEIALTVIALGWFFAVRTRQPAFHDERERWPIPRTYGVGILYALAWMPRVALLSVPLLYAAQQLGIGEVSPALEQILGPTADPWSAGLVFTSAVVLAPIAEEVLFRGLLLPHLGRMLPAFTAIYVGALLFGLLHVSHGVMLVGPLVLGAVLGWARLRSRGLAAPILLHMSFNAFALLGSWL